MTHDSEVLRMAWQVIVVLVVVLCKCRVVRGGKESSVCLFIVSAGLVWAVIV